MKEARQEMEAKLTRQIVEMPLDGPEFLVKPDSKKKTQPLIDFGA